MHLFAADDVSTLERLDTRFASAIRWIAEHDAAQLPAGRHAMDDDAMFIMVDAGELEPAERRRFEAHRRYIDLQLPLAGPECMAVCPLANVRGRELQPYDPDTDLVFFGDPAIPATLLHVAPGQVAIFMPDDVHKPCILPSGAASTAFRKLVVKVAVA